MTFRVALFCLSFHLLLLYPTSLRGQQRCSTVEYEKLRHQKLNQPETKEQFEQWMQQKIRDRRTQTFGIQQTQSTFVVPVVIHVIHNGEPVGTGTNISDAQIQSQIKVLNDDFNRQNTDASLTPPEFAPLSGSLNIQFVLAQSDPDGLNTNGITRTLGTKTSWTLSDNLEFKGLSYWPAENYMNIWVIKFSTSDIGYAQLPLSSQLQGLDNSSTDRLTDGVTIHYRAFGSISDGAFDLMSAYNKGRTATHEVGHFLGLRHIWGDGNCATDYVDDTPFQSIETTGCPSNPQPSCDIPSKPHKMFQNFIDYTNDVCMNIYTQGQVDRMTIVLQNSPRRLSLLTSPGSSPPVPAPNDAGIRNIIAPYTSNCSNPITPQIELRNYGNNIVNSTQVELAVNGVVTETKTFTGLNLASNQSVNVTFSVLNFPVSSTQLVSFSILQTNGTTDGKAINNILSVQATVPATLSLPINEPFNSLPPGWIVVNTDGAITWSNVTAPDLSPTNKAMYMNFHDYENEGTTDWLATPSFALPVPGSSQLRFDIAYQQYPGIVSDNLKVYALRGCNPDLSQGILLYDKSGSALATTPSSATAFIPSSNSQWRKSEIISLGNLTGSTNWQLAFVAKNGFGNNLYLDNVYVNDQVTNDLAIAAIVSPGLVHCQMNPAIQFSVKNYSSSTVTSFQVQRTLNSGSAVSQTFSNILINVGEEKTFALNSVQLNSGSNQCAITILNPNGLSDDSPANNSISFTTYVEQSQDATPLRKTFDNAFEMPWVSVGNLNARTWESATTNKKLSLVYKAFSNPTFGEEGWFVSPVLDLSRYTEQSLFFDLSYSQRPPADDRLKILGSTDCGLTYATVLYDKAGSEFGIGNKTTEWVPQSNTDWTREFVSLAELAGKKNVRLAFIATNANGNNIYIDNLEVFAGTDPVPAVTPLPYQIYYPTKTSLSNLGLTFHLNQKSDVRLQIYSVLGQIVVDNMLPDTLNQTYYFDLGQQSEGIYLFRLQIDGQVSTTKVFVAH